MNIENLTINGNRLIEPKETIIGGKQYLLTKFPAVAGREIFMQYSKGIKVSEDGKKFDIDGSAMADSANTVIKLLAYAFVKVGENWIRLETRELIDAHISEIMDLIELENQMRAHSFFSSPKGKTSVS
jgi:hypothetical protein